MKASRAIAGLFVVLLPIAALAQAGPNASVERVEKGLAPPVLVEGDSTWTIEERMRHYNVPGASVAVIENFKVVWAKGYGVKDLQTKEPVTEHTLFQAGSISKPVAATVAMKKVEEGKLALESDINESLKSWKLPDNELTAQKKVTLANLLSHTAGLTVHGFPGYEDGAKLPTLPEVLDGAPPANTAAVRVDLKPGTRFRYSGGGTTIMQLAVQDVEGKPFDVVAKKTVLDPIGMTESTYSQPLPESLRSKAASGHYRDGSAVKGRFHAYPEMAAAGLWTTPTDLAKFAIETQLSLAGKSNKVLSRATVERMLTPYLPPGPTGLGFFVEDHDGEVYFGHNGADEGFTAMLLVHKQKGYGAAVMINSDSFDLMPEILRAVAREYHWDNYMPTPYKPVAVAAATLDGYAGRYKVDEDTVVTVKNEGGRLAAETAFGSRLALVPISETEFVQRDSTAKYTFEKTATGAVAALSISGPDGARAPRLEGNDLVPLELLLGGKLAEAAEAYRGLKKSKPESVYVSEQRLNLLGYELMRRQKLPESIAVLKLNVELYPQSSNTYDSLGEAYMNNGDTKEAIASYKRSLELDPKNQNAVRMLEKLETSPKGAKP